MLIEQCSETLALGCRVGLDERVAQPEGFEGRDGFQDVSFAGCGHGVGLTDFVLGARWLVRTKREEGGGVTMRDRFEKNSMACFSPKRGSMFAI